MIRVDISADLNNEDETGLVWTFLDEALDPTLVRPGALVVAGSALTPAVCEVVDLVEKAASTIDRPPANPAGSRGPVQSSARPSRRLTEGTSRVGTVEAPPGAPWPGRSDLARQSSPGQRSRRPCAGGRPRRRGCEHSRPRANRAVHGMERQAPFFEAIRKGGSSLDGDPEHFHDLLDERNEQREALNKDPCADKHANVGIVGRQRPANEVVRQAVTDRGQVHQQEVGDRWRPVDPSL